MRRWGLVALFVLLAAAAGAARLQLEAQGEQRVPSSLLYLPKGPFLRALAFGQEETLADLLYIWSIQYYSSYDNQSRYQYLTAVYEGAITELDPHFEEAYMVGALIMSVEARKPELAFALYDKGVANNPNSWEIPFFAGWEAYYAKDFVRARDYWMKGARIPGAPPQLMRLAAKMLEKKGDRASALGAYYEALEKTQDPKTRKVIQSWINRLQLAILLDQVRSGLARFKETHGRCPAHLKALVAVGLLPADSPALEFSYNSNNCEVLPPPGFSFGGRR